MSNINYDPDITTGGGGITIKLTGDCEFDAVTVSDGDTLDLNGKRMECESISQGGQLMTDTAGDGLLICNSGFNSSPNDNMGTSNLIIRGTGTNDVSSFKTTMFDFGAGNTDAIFNWGKNGDTDPNIIIASGTVDNDTRNYSQECNNLTIATGAVSYNG